MPNFNTEGEFPRNIPLSQSLKYMSQNSGNSPSGVFMMLSICEK